MYLGFSFKKRNIFITKYIIHIYIMYVYLYIWKYNFCAYQIPNWLFKCPIFTDRCDMAESYKCIQKGNFECLYFLLFQLCIVEMSNWPNNIKHSSGSLVQNLKIEWFLKQLLIKIRQCFFFTIILLMIIVWKIDRIIYEN